jgi:sugar fermentation stimulation protein A
MRFASPLIRGTLLRRYKRFLADVRLDDGTEVTAHCPNSGSMLSVSTPGAEVWLSAANDAKRALPYTWELIRISEHLVGINTARPNALVSEAIEAGLIAELSGYTRMRREVGYGRNSRVDLLLEADGRPKCFVEVKNVTLRRDHGPGGPVEFPDAVTVRGSKHLDELSEQVRSGNRSVMVFLAQRSDGHRFRIADDVDPVYAERLQAAKAAGVEAIAYRCRVSTAGIAVEGSIAMEA